jgi:hypothetical protein
LVISRSRRSASEAGISSAKWRSLASQPRPRWGAGVCSGADGHPPSALPVPGTKEARQTAAPPRAWKASSAGVPGLCQCVQKSYRIPPLAEREKRRRQTYRGLPRSAAEVQVNRTLPFLILRRFAPNWPGAASVRKLKIGRFSAPGRRICRNCAFDHGNHRRRSFGSVDLSFPNPMGRPGAVGWNALPAEGERR